MTAWLLASTVSNVRCESAEDPESLEAFERSLTVEEKLMQRLDARELLAVRHEAVFDD